MSFPAPTLEQSGRPEPVVFILGGTGSTEETLAPYRDLYEVAARHIDETLTTPHINSVLSAIDVTVAAPVCGVHHCAVHGPGGLPVQPLPHPAARRPPGRPAGRARGGRQSSYRSGSQTHSSHHRSLSSYYWCWVCTLVAVHCCGLGGAGLYQYLRQELHTAGHAPRLVGLLCDRAPPRPALQQAVAGAWAATPPTAHLLIRLAWTLVYLGGIP